MLRTRMRGSARGIPKLLYSGYVSADYICTICLEVLNDPYQCKNGHLNCKECWNDLILSGSRSCTLCRVEVMNLSYLSKSLLVKQQISALHVKCDCLDHIDASHSGCQWTGTLSEREERQCEHLFSKCTHQGCHQKVKIESLKFHIVQCPKRPKMCIRCNMFFPAEDLKGRHHGACVSPVPLVPCTCGVLIKEVDLAAHKKECCPMTMIQCPIFRDIGVCVDNCDGTIKRGASSLHLGANAALIRFLYMRNQELLEQVYHGYNVSLISKLCLINDLCNYYYYFSQG
jgi:hypothetical protein